MCKAKEESSELDNIGDAGLWSLSLKRVSEIPVELGISYRQELWESHAVASKDKLALVFESQSLANLLTMQEIIKCMLIIVLMYQKSCAQVFTEQISWGKLFSIATGQWPWAILIMCL